MFLRGGVGVGKEEMERGLGEASEGAPIKESRRYLNGIESATGRMWRRPMISPPTHPLNLHRGISAPSPCTRQARITVARSTGSRLKMPQIVDAERRDRVSGQCADMKGSRAK